MMSASRATRSQAAAIRGGLFYKLLFYAILETDNRKPVLADWCEKGVSYEYDRT